MAPPALIVAWKPLQKEVHTGHYQSSDVNYTLHILTWSSVRSACFLFHFIQRLSFFAALCLSFLCLFVLCFPSSISVTHTRTHTHTFHRLSSSNWHLISYLVSVSLLWLELFLFPGHGWHWNRTFTCSHSTKLLRHSSNTSFNKSSSSSFYNLIPLSSSLGGCFVFKYMRFISNS